MTGFGAVVLAAGASTRMGRPKQLLPLADGRTALRAAVENVAQAGFSPVVVVLGSSAARVSAEVAGIPVHVVVHDGWAAGMGSSLAAGAEEAVSVSPELDGLLVAVCDQPGATAAHLLRLRDAFVEARPRVAASAYAGIVGVPALFARPLFGALREMKGGEGARSLVHRHADATIAVPLPGGQIDLDTPGDYRAYLRGHALPRRGEGGDGAEPRSVTPAPGEQPVPADDDSRRAIAPAESGRGRGGGLHTANQPIQDQPCSGLPSHPTASSSSARCTFPSAGRSRCPPSPSSGR